MNDNLITFDPPIAVNPNVILGDMVVTTAEVIPQDDPAQVVASIFGDGRVISVPFITDASTSIASALKSEPVTPKERVPEMISRAQFVIAARRVLGLTDVVASALIQNLPNEEDRLTAQDLWENAGEFHRNNNMLLVLAQIGGYTDAQLDDVFKSGAASNLS
jgi:hypothetical protein